MAFRWLLQAGLGVAVAHGIAIGELVGRRHSRTHLQNRLMRGGGKWLVAHTPTEVVPPHIPRACTTAGGQPCNHRRTATSTIATARGGLIVLVTPKGMLLLAECGASATFEDP